MKATSRKRSISRDTRSIEPAVDERALVEPAKQNSFELGIERGAVATRPAGLGQSSQRVLHGWGSKSLVTIGDTRLLGHTGSSPAAGRGGSALLGQLDGDVFHFYSVRQ